MRILLDHDKSGASIDLKDKDGDTALSAARDNGHTEITALLLERGKAEL